MKYPLLPYSQLVYNMTRWMPVMYRFPAILRWKDGAKEKDRIENAIRIALKNHPVFSMRVDWNGMHYASEPNDILHGKYHDVNIYTIDNDLYLSISGSRILGDGKSGQIVAEDIGRAYNCLPLLSDDYWGYVARYEQGKLETHYSQSKEWLMLEFEDGSVPVRPSIDRRWLATLLPPRAGLYEDDYTILQSKIENLKVVHFLSQEGIFSLCVALAIADYCGTNEAALTWAYDGREAEGEQRIFGSLHRDVPFQIRRKSENESEKKELIRQARNQIRSGIAHSDYPYTLTAPYNKRWNYAVNVLRIAEPENMIRNIDLPIEIVSVPKQKYAYALLDVEIHEHPQNLSIWFRYSATHYKEESIRRFAALVRKYVLWLID